MTIRQKSATLSITNWETHQTYRKDRGAPPWIKVHRSIFENEKWILLTDAERGQLVAMWVLGGRQYGVIPASPEMLMKICHMDTPPNVNKFIELGLLATTCQPVDDQLTPTRRPHDTPETEAEAEAEAETETDCLPDSKISKSIHRGNSGERKPWDYDRETVEVR